VGLGGDIISVAMHIHGISFLARIFHIFWYFVLVKDNS
jgi:hypothetical protein